MYQGTRSFENTLIFEDKYDEDFKGNPNFQGMLH